MEENKSSKSWLMSLMLCWFTGFLGIHRMYVGKIGSGFAILYGTIFSVCMLYYSLYVGLVSFVVVGSFVLYDFLNILFKGFKDCYGKEVTTDNISNR